MSIIGDMISYEAEGYGRLYQDVVPTQSLEKNQTSLGSGVELEIHTEQAFSKLKPDVFSLACLRGNADAYTHVLPVLNILTNMVAEEIELLRQPLWYTSVDLSFKLNGHDFIDGDVRGPLPILSGPIEDPILIFDQDLMMGITEQANEMIKKIVNIYHKTRLRHNLTPGEIVIIDNHRAVHGRSSFKPLYDGHDRFLTRSFTVFDYSMSSYARNGTRTIAAIYS